jgi:hypothetical protein
MITFGKRSISIGFNILAILPHLIQLAELEFGGGTGPQKRAAVIEVAKDFAVAGGSAVAANNPKYSDIIGAVVDKLVPAVLPAPDPAPVS